MFTGLIEAVEPIKANVNTKDGRRLSMPLGPTGQGAQVGDSICVNGVCLTISELASEVGIFDVMAETVRVSTLGELKPQEMVNLERALTPETRMGGHIVQGHVDGVGQIEHIERSGGRYVIRIGADMELMDLMIPKGSVAVDGVSLTIVEVKDHTFSVSLIPTTLAKTNLGERKKYDKVNLEVDIIGKWINKRLDQILSMGNKSSVLTAEKLRQQGFI